MGNDGALGEPRSKQLRVTGLGYERTRVGQRAPLSAEATRHTRPRAGRERRHRRYRCASMIGMGSQEGWSVIDRGIGASRHHSPTSRRLPSLCSRDHMGEADRRSEANHCRTKS